MIRGPNGRITRIRYVLPRHKAANWVGPGRGRKSTRPGANGVVELSPFEFLDRLADLVPPPRKHRHRYHGVFAPNHKLRKAVTSLAVGNVGKRREVALSPPLPLGEGRGEGAPNHAKPRSHGTSRIAWAKLLARLGEEFPLECPNCGGDIRLISFITAAGLGETPRRHEKNATPGGRWPIQGAAFRAEAGSGGGSNRLKSRSSVGRRLRKCHWPGYPPLAYDRRAAAR